MSAESVRHTVSMSNPDQSHVYATDFQTQILAFIDQHRAMLLAALEGLTEEEARRRLVSSKTTLLGLLKHAIFVERVWFQEARTGLSRSDLGIGQSPDESFDLGDADTIASVAREYLETCQASREAVAGVSASTVWSGNRRGPLTVQWIQLHALRELAQHCGHAEILREQILAARES